MVAESRDGLARTVAATNARQHRQRARVMQQRALQHWWYLVDWTASLIIPVECVTTAAMSNGNSSNPTNCNLSVVSKSKSRLRVSIHISLRARARCEVKILNTKVPRTALCTTQSRFHGRLHLACPLNESRSWAMEALEGRKSLQIRSN